jgi:5-methylcytosine-specific restriction endonuclease McrA
MRSDADVLLREAREFARQERWVTAQLLVRLAAVEKRELFAPCGYSSMWEYCLGELQMSEDAASRRLWAARKCREFPALFDALADGRIHLTAVHTLATHLRSDNADELIAAATGRSKAQLRDWLACRFPQPAAPTLIQPVTSAAPSTAAPPVQGLMDPPPAECKKNLHAPARVPVPSSAVISPNPQVPLRDRSHVDPLNAEQVKVQFTMSRQVLAKMQQAQDLLGHQVPRTDIAALFEKLLDMAIPALEKKKFSATDRPRAPRATTPTHPRTIPAHVQRDVWKRDDGRCTFKSATGRRCEATRSLEFDHVKPVALGGQGSVDNVRLLCRKHNQLEAERRRVLISSRPTARPRSAVAQPTPAVRRSLAPTASARVSPAGRHTPAPEAPPPTSEPASRSPHFGSGILRLNASTNEAVGVPPRCRHAWTSRHAPS